MANFSPVRTGSAEETTFSETTAKYSDEELELMAQDMPEIVFVLAYQKEGNNILGCYVMNTGEIKLFDFRTIAPNEVYDVRDVYNRLEEVTCDRIEPLNPSVNYEERLITEDELKQFNEKVQKLTDKEIEKIDVVLKEKEKQIMEI